MSATAVSSGGETHQTILPKREPMISEDENTDTEHLRNELAENEVSAENAQSEQHSKTESDPVDSASHDGNSSSEDQKK